MRSLAARIVGCGLLLLAPGCATYFNWNGDHVLYTVPHPNSCFETVVVGPTRIVEAELSDDEIAVEVEFSDGGDRDIRFGVAPLAAGEPEPEAHLSPDGKHARLGPWRLDLLRGACLDAETLAFHPRLRVFLRPPDRR